MASVKSPSRPFVGFRPRTADEFDVVRRYLKAQPLDARGRKVSIASFIRPAWEALVRAAQVWEQGQKQGAA